MAKDGTNRGGARIGAGQKKKPLADKILEGNPGRRKLMVMEFTDAAELEGESMPPPRDYLAAKQKNGKTTLAVEIYEKTWQWLTISDASKLYTILDEELRKTIALHLGFTSNNRHKIVENLLHCITILRNICAHGGRLYNRLFTRKPWLSKKEKNLLRVENGHKVYDKLFSYILVLKSITLPQDFKLVVEHITQIKEQYPLVDFKHYGFPENWQEIL